MRDLYSESGDLENKRLFEGASLANPDGVTDSYDYNSRHSVASTTRISLAGCVPTNLVRFKAAHIHINICLYVYANPDGIEPSTFSSAN